VAQDVEDAAERGAVGDASRAAVVPPRFGRQVRSDGLPEIVADQVRRGHGRAYADHATNRKNPLRLSWPPH
jgi:hypothetical protein